MLATLLVMNSHAEMMYPKFTFLASGGAIGDALFMFSMLMGFVFYFYKLLSAVLFAKLYQKPAAKWIVLFIGGLCLESYLFHMTLFTPAFNNLFPLNLLLIYVAVIVCAYVVRCIARTILQTFQKENYRWGEVFKLV